MKFKLSTNPYFGYFSLIVLFLFYTFVLIKKSFFLLFFFLFFFFSFCTIYFTKFKNYNLFFASVFFVLSLAEISINHIYSIVKTGTNNKPATYFSNDSSYGSSDYWTMTSHGHSPREGTYKSKKLTTDGRIVYDVIYKINEHGQRLAYKTNSPINVNFFGCSFTFGEGLNDNQTLPYLYGQLKNINTKNFGFHGYGAHNALNILSSIDNNPGDINIIMTGLFHIKRQNCSYDWTDNHPKYSLKNKVLIHNGKCIPANQKYIRNILKMSNLFNFSMKLIRSKKINKTDLDTYIAILKKMSDLSRINNQRFVVGFFDSLSSGLDQNAKEYVIENIINISDQFVLIDLPKDEGIFSIPNDGHPTYYYNQQLTKLLDDNIEIKF